MKAALIKKRFNSTMFCHRRGLSFFTEGGGHGNCRPGWPGPGSARRKKTRLC